MELHASLLFYCTENLEIGCMCVCVVRHLFQTHHLPLINSTFSSYHPHLTTTRFTLTFPIPVKPTLDFRFSSVKFIFFRTG
ncbi:hypothetical protein RJT34_23072 [Clitoria ternatea]|uniref:Uncharacterized protein n=1 Tax=Clitoria ternatea TaxID=43366 RepID=A0AAN9II24_CLITE